MKEMILLILIFSLGGIFNRIRGGWLTDIIKKNHPHILIFLKELEFWDEVENELKGVKDLNALIYSLVFTSLFFNYDDEWKLFVFFMALFYGSMRGGFSWGWGGYIDGMINRKIDRHRTDVKLLDTLLSDKFPVFTCWLALSLRGLMASCVLYVPFLIASYFIELSPSFYYIPLIGLAMGTVYLLACEVCQRVTFRGNGWQWGEVIFGGYLWSTIYLLIKWF